MLNHLTETGDIPSHIMRELGRDRQHFRHSRYTLTYNEGTSPQTCPEEVILIYPHI